MCPTREAGRRLGDGLAVAQFLRTVLRYLRGRPIGVRDWGSSHKELLVGEHVRGNPRVDLEGLAGYATELNPVEGL